MSLRPGELERSRKVYQQLGLQDFAPFDEIKRRYRELALLFHPDSAAKHNNPTDTERFVLINEAYQILSDETRRSRYDSALKSAQAAAAATALPSAYNVPSSAAPSRAFYSRETSYDPNNNGGGSPADPLNTRSHFQSRHSRSASNNHRGRSASAYGPSSTAVPLGPNSPTNASASATAAAPPGYYSSEQNEEFKRREKQRFADMKRRLESERNAAAEQERQRVMKQQTEQRREEQRRRREQDRLKERLDKALLGGKPGAAPLARASSSTNQPSGGVFRSASSLGRQSTNLPPSSAGGGANNNNFLSSPTRAYGSPVSAHTFEKHGTFSSGRGGATTRAALSPVAAPPPKPEDEDEAESDQQQQQQQQKENATKATPSKSKQQSASPTERGGGGGYGSPEFAEIALRQITKDMEHLPVEEEEEREHFLKLQERHERTMLVSVFKQRAVDIESELFFRAFYDEEEGRRFDIDGQQVVEYSVLTVEIQARMCMERLLRESVRNLHGMLAWHDNVWTHLKQNMSRLLLLGEREQLARAAVVEAEEEKAFGRLAIYGQMLNRKFKVGAVDEETTRQQLFQGFYNGAKAIAATRTFLARREPIYREEQEARGKLTVELQEVLRRGKVSEEHSDIFSEISEQRTHALARYIAALQIEIASMKSTVANHQLVVMNMEQQMEHQKQAHMLETAELEGRLQMLRGDMLGLETTVARLREATLNAEDEKKLAEERAVAAKEQQLAAEQKLEQVTADAKAAADRRVADVQEQFDESKAESTKALAGEKKEHEQLRQKHEKLAGKFKQASEMLTEMAERDEAQKAELEQLRREVTALRMQQFEAAENGGGGGGGLSEQQQQRHASSVSPMSASASPEQQQASPPLTTTSGSSGIQTPVPRTPTSKQQQQPQFGTPMSSSSKLPPSSPGAGKKQAPPLPTQQQQSGKKSVPATPTNMSNQKSAPPSPHASKQTAAAGRSISQSNTAVFAPDHQQQQQQQQQQYQDDEDQQQNVSVSSASAAPLETAEHSLANRHARTARLEHRLYTAAAAASAASIVIAQRESTKTPASMASPASLPHHDPAVSPIPRGGQPGASTPSSSGARTPQQPPSPSSPTAAAAAARAKQQQQVGSASASSSSPPNNNRASYRELSNAAHPRSVKQIAEFEADDAAAVAQRDAVSSFLQRQHAPVAGYTDDPRQAHIAVRAPVPGKGILEYAGIKKPSAPQQAADGETAAAAAVDTSVHSEGCSTCDMNNDAVSKLVTTTDKLLMRNAALVDDNALLAQAVVSMNGQRQQEASKANK